jgi:hypothetical protein
VIALDDRLRRLMNAIEMDDRDLVGRLLNGPIADLNSVDPEWRLSPLALAVDAEADGASQTGSRRDLALVRILVEAGASPLVPGDRGKTAIDIARDYDWPEAIELLEAAVKRRSA